MKKILLVLSALMVLIFSNVDLNNKTFNSAGNIFSSSSNKIQKRKDTKNINPSDDFWTSDRFNF